MGTYRNEPFFKRLSAGTGNEGGRHKGTGNFLWGFLGMTVSQEGLADVPLVYWEAVTMSPEGEFLLIKFWC